MQGIDGIDTDIPHPAEAWLFNNCGLPGKFFFALNQILFYALRPTLVREQAVDGWFLLNFAVQAAFDAAQIDPRRWPSFERALASLTASDFLVPEGRDAH